MLDLLNQGQSVFYEKCFIGLAIELQKWRKNSNIEFFALIFFRQPVKCDTRPCRAENANCRVKIKQKIKRVGVRPWGLHHAFTRERVCVCEREKRERERVSMWEIVKERVCVCVSEREREWEKRSFFWTSCKQISHSQSSQKRVWIIIKHAISIVVNLYLLIQLQAVVVVVVDVLRPNFAAVAPRYPFFKPCCCCCCCCCWCCWNDVTDKNHKVVLTYQLE